MRVAVYEGPGALRAAGCIRALLGDRSGHEIAALSAGEIRAGGLDEAQVVVFPGGSGSGQSAALASAGQEAVRRFVASGGGFLGLCAGAYLGAAAPRRYGLGLVPVRCADTQRWRRGVGDVRVARDARSLAAARVLPAREGTFYYHNGPLLVAQPLPGRDEVEPWAVFRCDIDGRGVMPGALAVAAARFGAGRALLFSPHPEYTGDGPYAGETVLPAALAWCGALASEET